MKSPLFCILLCLAFLCTTCTKNTDTTLHEIDAEQQAMLDFLALKGFNPDSISFEAEDLIYENDMVIFGDQLRQLMDGTLATAPIPEPEEADWKTGLASDRQRGHVEDSRHHTVAANAVNDIRYFVRASVANDCGNGWVNAIHRSANRWTDLNYCRVTLVEVSSQSSADLIFASDLDPILPASMQNLDNSTLARAGLSFDGMVSPFVSINSDKDNQIRYFKTTAIMHEIGHTIGLMHTGTNEGQHLHGTPQNQLLSIMNTNVGAAGPYFQSGDARAARLFYPSSLPTPTNFSISRPSSGTVRIEYSNPNFQTRPYYWVRLQKYDANQNLIAESFVRATVNGLGDHTINWGGHGTGTFHFAVRAYNFRRDVWSNRTQRLLINL